MISHEPIIALQPFGNGPVLEFAESRLEDVWARDFWDTRAFTDALRYVQAYRAVIVGGSARYVISPNAFPARADDIDIYTDGHVSPAMLGHFFQGRVVSADKIMDDGRPSHVDRVHTIIRQPKGANIQIIESHFAPSGDGSCQLPPMSAVSFFDFTITRCGIYSTKRFQKRVHRFLEPEVTVIMNREGPDELRCFYQEPDFFRDEQTMTLAIHPARRQLQVLTRLWKYVKMGYRLSDADAVALLPILKQASTMQARLAHAVTADQREDPEGLLATLFCGAYQQYMAKRIEEQNQFDASAWRPLSEGPNWVTLEEGTP